MNRNDSLRRKAEKLLQEKGKAINQKFYQEDLETLVEELSIYQIELAQQNEELERSQQHLEETKNKYTDLFNNAPIGYAILDKNMHIIEVNKTLTKMLELANHDLIDKRFNSLIHPDYQDQLHTSRTQLEKNIDNSIDVKIKRNHNDYFFVRLIATCETEQDKKYRIAVIDISIQKKLEFDLIKESKIAQKNEKLKSVFLANMSHEIRTPLNGILGFADLICVPNVSHETIIEYAKIISDSGNRLLDLINNILEISKIDSESMRILNTKTNLIELTNNVQNLFQANATNKSIGLFVEIDEQVKALKEVDTDKMKLNQILNNLVGNAIKYTSTGSVTMRIQRNKNELLFSVCDTGSGIHTNVLPYIFERYYQDDRQENNFNRGSGLGLSICKSLVEMLGGTIWVESVIKKGSTFTFTLPIKSTNKIP